MKIEEMSKHFKDKNCGVGTYSIKILSTNQNVILRQLTIGDTISLAKLAMETPGSQTILINQLLNRLAIQGIAFDSITELDRVFLIAGVKESNFMGMEEAGVKFKCSRCKLDQSFKFNTLEYMEKINELHKDPKPYDTPTFACIVGLPSAASWEAWMKYTDTLRNQMKNNPKATDIIEKYEFLPFIKQLHKINGIVVEGLIDSLSYEKRIELIDNMSVGDIEKLKLFLSENGYMGLQYGVVFDVKCSSCANINPVLVGAEHFFSF